MSQPYFLRTLGRPALIAPDGSPVRFRVKKHLALLIYLAVEPRTPQRREYLADLLWPNAPAGEGRHSLATAVSILRGIFGPGAIESTRDTIRLSFGGLATDLERLEAGDVLGGELEPPLDIGDLLQDLELTDAPGFSHWKDRLRAHWRPMIQAALLTLLDRARRSGDWRRLDQVADRLFELEELSEQGMRAKMEAVALAGDRVAALKLYGHWASRLQEELAAVPSPLMQRFAEHLRRGGLAGGGSRPVTSPGGVAGPFVGRAAEYRALYEVWESTLERRPRHAIVRGESGVGKTTLVARILAAAALEGTVVARVRCYELEQEIPYAALTALLGVLLDRPGAAATPPECLADLALILPAVRQRFPNLPPPAEAQGEGARLRFSEAAFQLITAVAEEQPVVLAIDDLHLADDVSVAVLHHALRRLDGQRVMMVFAGRTGDTTQSPNAARLIESAVRLGVRILDVEPLDEEASDQALDLLFAPGGIRPGTAARRALVRAARGYPMVLVLLARDWDAHRSASIALSLEAMTRDPAGQGRSTATAQDAYALLLDRVLQRLDAGTRPVLDLAAVLGSRMNELRFYGLLGLSSAQTMGALGVLGDHHVMRSGGPGIEFVNDLVRAHLYLRIPAPFRRQLHHLVAEDLLQRSEEVGTVGGLELAWHLMRCGRVEEAVECLLRGAREAIDHGAAWEAERALVTGEPELTGEARTKGRLLLVEALQEQGRMAESWVLIDTTDFGCGSHVQEFVSLFKLAAQRYVSPRAPLELGGIVDELISLAQATANPDVKGRALGIAGSLLDELKDDLRSDSFVREAAHVQAEQLSPQLRVRLLEAQARSRYITRDFEGCDEVLATALTIVQAERIENSLALSLHAGRGAVASAEGRYQDATGHWLAEHSLSSHTGNELLARHAAGNLVMCYARLGAHDEVEKWAARALTEASPDSAIGPRLVAIKYLAISRAMRGAHEAAFETIRFGDSLCAHVTIPWLGQSWSLSKADALWLLGRRAESLRTAKFVTGVGETMPASPAIAGPFCRWIAKLRSNTEHGHVVHPTVATLHARLGELDRMDQAEVLAAYIHELRVLDHDPESSENAFRGVLAKLPPYTETLLRQLDFLRPNWLEPDRKARHRPRRASASAGRASRNQ